MTYKKVALIVVFALLHATAPVAQGQNATGDGSNPIVFTEVAPDAPHIVDSAQYAGEMVVGMKVEGVLSDDYDVDLYKVCNRFNVSALFRLGVQTPYENMGGRPFSSALHVVYEQGKRRTGYGPSGDLRSQNHLLLEAGECAVIGVSNTGEFYYLQDPYRFSMTTPSHNPSGVYAVTVMQVIPVSDEVVLPAQEVNDLRKVSTVIECDGGALVFPHDGDAGVLRSIFEIGESCAGFKFRVVSNTQGDCSQITPSGDVVEAQSYNVRQKEHPAGYLSEAPHQDAYDHGAYCEAAAVPGNLLAVGPFAHNGTVRNQGDPWYKIRTGPSVGRIRQDDMVIVPIKPEMVWAADRPLQFTEDGWAEIRWTGSRQVDAVEVHLPEYGITQVVPLHEVGDYARTWSASAPEGEEFTARFELPANKGGNASANSAWPPTRGSRVNYVLTPLGVDGHSARGRLEHLAYTGATSVATEGEGDLPTTFDLGSAYPNPTPGQTTINLVVEKPQVVTIELFDSLARRVRTVSQEFRLPGHYSVPFNASDMPAGVYHLRAIAEGHAEYRSVVVVR